MGLETSCICTLTAIRQAYEDIADVTIAIYALPKENKELYSKFPGLKQYQGLEISFESCVMDGKYSIDGLPHEINSFEEFDQWFKPEEY